MDTIDVLLEQVRYDAPVRRVLVGVHWTAVVLGTEPVRCGLASTWPEDAPHTGPPVPDAAALTRRTGRELAELVRSASHLEASIGMAALNSLLEVDVAACSEVNAETLILQRGADRRVAIVGHFPFVDRVRDVAAACWVVERQPRPGDLPASEAATLLPQADVVALTGTALVNRSFDALMRLCRPDAFVVVLGPSTPLAPALLATGVDAISGTLVTDADLVLRAISEGATFRQIRRAGGVRLLTMERSEADE